MDIKKAVISGIIYYAVVFLVMSALMFTPIWGTNAAKYLGIVMTVFAVYFIAQKYYFKKRPANPMMEGLYLGIIMALTSFLIEIPMMVYGFAKDIGWGWFGQWNMMVGYLLIFTTAVVASMKK